MSDNSSCIPSIQLLKEKKQDLKKCIIFKQNKRNGETKLTSKPNGIQKISDASKKLNDSLVANLSATELKSIRYHVKNCHGPYILKSTRISEESAILSPIENEDEIVELENTSTPPTTRQISGGSNAKSIGPKKLCIICNASKKKGNKKLYRISEDPRSRHFLAAIEFNKDEVQQRCIFWKCHGDIYAADIMYHGNCLYEYLLSFDREIKRLSQYHDESTSDSSIQSIPT